jgi:hypothetical protein
MRRGALWKWLSVKILRGAYEKISKSMGLNA